MNDEASANEHIRLQQRRQGSIRVGIGGWTYAPWRGAFYPDGLKHADELK